MNSTTNLPPGPPKLPPAMPMPAASRGDATGGVIPYKNPLALTAYYLGIFGIIPLFGPVLAIPAIILGVLGLKKHKENPIIKGVAHAWIGIVLGAISLIYHGVIALLIVMNHQ